VIVAFEELTVPGWRLPQGIEMRAWGREIASASVRRRFELADAQEIPNWSDQRYADWITEDVPGHSGIEVRIGHLPALDWLSSK